VAGQELNELNWPAQSAVDAYFVDILANINNRFISDA
jgi:hypothetical protein